MCIIVLSIAAALFAPSALSRPFMGFCVFLALAVMVIQILYRATSPRPRNWISVEILFMLGYLVVHTTYPLFWLIGLAPSENALWYDQSVVCYAAAMTAAGLACFALGFNIPADRYNCVQWPANVDRAALMSWKRIGTVLFLAGAVALAAWARLVGDVISSGVYTYAPGEYGAHITFLLADTLLRLGLLVLTITAALLTRKWKIGLIPKIGLALFVGWFAILGDRSTLVTMALLVAAAYSEYVRLISFKVLICIIVGGLFFMGVIRVARWSPDRTVSSFIQTAREESHQISWDTGLMNFGGSVRTLHAAVATIPSEYNYRLGELQITTAAGLIPFSRRLLPANFVTSATFLTAIINRGNMESGAGTTVVADLYCDFGFPGVMVALFTLGLLSKQIQQRARAAPSLTWGVAHAALIPVMTLMARYTVMTAVRSVLWPVIAVYLLSCLFGLRRRVDLPTVAPLPPQSAYPSRQTGPVVWHDRVGRGSGHI
ncbi:MAG: oligosaccharide repeat unit polymerase [Phycisphaerae bacterium]|nr:oligosaccharide repeat unit polymerase [Phycisphaerae bacterium]